MAVIACAGCGSRVNAEAEMCPECGSEPRTGASGEVGDPEYASFANATYERGLRWAPTPVAGTLVFTRQMVGIGGDDPPVLLWMGDVTSVDMYASHPVKVVGRSAEGTVMLAGIGLVLAGPVGAAAGGAIGLAGASETMNRVRMVIRARRDEEVWDAVVTVTGLYPNAIRDRLSPLLGSLGIPLRSSVD